MTSTVDISKLLVLSEVNTKGEVPLHGLVAVIVEENPSTGYHWKYELAVCTEGLLDPLNNIFVPGRRVLGAPGVQVFLFGAERAGWVGVMFRLYPPGKIEPVREFACSIEITPEN
jgi:predicted secreted protein